MGVFSRFVDNNGKIAKDVRSYFSQRYDLLKVELLEKSSRILAVLFSMLVILVCALAVLIYLSFAFISWINASLNSTVAGYLIVALLFLVLLLVIIVFNEKLFLNPIIRKLGKILYEEKDDDGEEEDDNEE
ncbi:MAG: phage holin family protein [Bacteroidales bacterium]|jgi:hypothetical protein|nr:phage holin family protein [Bacteroidales bacterium]